MCIIHAALNLIVPIKLGELQIDVVVIDVPVIFKLAGLIWIFLKSTKNLFDIFHLFSQFHRGSIEFACSYLKIK